MVDFKDAITKGIQSARKAENNNAEINAVVADLSSQTTELTGGAVTISLGMFPRTVGGLIANALALPGDRDSKHLFEGLGAAKGSDASSRILLAEIERSSSGYPVTVRFSDQVFVAFSKTELVDALLNLMMHPETGKKITKLQSQKQSSIAE